MIKAESGEVHMDRNVEECTLYKFYIGIFRCLLMELGEKEAQNSGFMLKGSCFRYIQILANGNSNVQSAF